MRRATQRRAHLLCAALLTSAGCTYGAEVTHTLSTDGNGGGAPHDPTMSSGNGTAPPPPATCAQIRAELKATLETTFGETGFVGVTSAVLTPECEPWVGAAGNASLDQPMFPDRLMRVGSITQTYVAAALIALAERGQLSLDDTVVQHLPGLGLNDELTVRTLLRHTSGLRDYLDPSFLEEAAANPDQSVPPELLVALGSTPPAEFPPGQSWSPSRTNYIGAGLLLESVTESTVGTVLQDEVLQPLDLDATFFVHESPAPVPLASGFDSAGNDVTHLLHTSVLWSAGGMVSNALDVARWGHALFGERFLDEASTWELLDAVPTGSGASYGLGVYVYEHRMGELGRALGHHGNAPGYQSEVVHLRDHDITVAVLMNEEMSSPEPYITGLLEVLTHQ